MASDRAAAFGDLLRHARRAAGLTQEELAERAGISVRAISDLERDTSRSPRKDTLDLLTGALDLDAAERRRWEQARRRSSVQASFAQISRMKARSTRTPNPPAPLDRDEPFIGRDREMRDAIALLDTALRGQRQLLLVAGEPGIGKTRLAELVAREATRRGAQVYWGRCYGWDGAPPYWPWVEVLRSCAESLEPPELIRQMGAGAPFLLQVVPDLAGMLGVVPPLPPMDPEQSRFRLLDAIARFLRQSTRQQPFVAVLEDLHWADEPSLRLLEFISRELQDAPMLLIGTFRDSEVGRDHPLGRSLPAIARAAEPWRIMLKGLSADEVGQYIRAATGIDATTSLVRTVSEGTDGNPFYLGEVVRLLQAEGRLDGRPGTTDGARLMLPESVRDVVGRRLDRLSGDCNAVLGIAAVIGRDFTLNLLERTSGRPALELLDMLDEASGMRIIEPGPSFGHYRFSHAFIQQTMYEELSTATRLHLHDRVGRALEGFHAADLPAHSSELAYHFAKAPIGANIQKAIDYALLAGARAVGQVAWETAIIHYEQALQLLGLLDTPDLALRCDTLLALGEAHFHVNATSSMAVDILLQAADLARRLGSPERLARAAISVHGFNIYESYAIVEQGDLLREALAGLEHGDSVLRARLLSQLAVVEWRELPTPDLPRSLCEEAIAMARRLGDALTLAFALAVRHATVAGPDNLDERIADATEVTQLARSAGDLPLTVWGQFWQRSDLLEQGDAAGAVAAMAAVIAEGAKLRTQVFDCVVTETRIMQALVAGEYRSAEPAIDHLIDVVHTVEDGEFWRFRRQQQYPYQFIVRREQERLSELEPETRQYRGNACTPIYRIMRLFMDWEFGNNAEAMAEWSIIAARDFCDIPRDAVWMGKMALLSEISSLVNDDRRAYILMQLLTPYAHRIVVDGPNSLCYGAASHYLGLLASTLTDWEQAVANFEMALATHDRLGLRPYSAWTRFALANALICRNVFGDHGRAVDLLDQALALGTEMSMAKLVRRTSKLRERALR